MSSNQLQTEQLVAHPKIKGSASALYIFMVNKVQRGQTVKLKELVYLWIDTVVKSDQTIRRPIVGLNDKISVKTVNRRQYMRQNWNSTEARGYAITWAKYHIGNLVVNGYVTVIPRMDLDLSNLTLKTQGRKTIRL